MATSWNSGIAKGGSLPPLTLASAWSQWRLDIPVLVVVLAAAAWYLGAARLRRSGRPWPWPRTLMFLLGGLGSIVVATMSALGVYDRTLFWPEAVQNMLLIGLCPVLLGLGAPLRLAAESRRRPGPAPRWLGTAGRVLTFPLVSSLLGLALLFWLYLTPYYEATLRSDVLHELLRVQLLVAGCLFVWPMLGGELLPSWCTHPVRVAIGLVDGLVDALPGLVVMLTGRVIARGYYRSVGRTWGPSLHWDQTIGGGLMLTLAELVAVPFIGGQLLSWIRADAVEAAEADRRLDAVAVAQAAAAGDIGTPELMRPWWETEPGPLGDRYRHT
ncbi:MAG: cytochrome c oxidase assembly protein [Streptosporangiaceae bacterium]